MLKFVLLELLKAYAKKLTMPRQREKHYSNYVIAILGVVGLILLIVADYIYLYDAEDYALYLPGLLKTSTAFFILAVITKLFSLWMNRKERQEEVVNSLAITSIAKEFLPIIVSAIPIGIIAYVLWAKIQVKVLGKKLSLKDSLKRLL